MKKPQGQIWFYAKTGTGERLFRLQPKGQGGRVALPSIGKVKYKLQNNGRIDFEDVPEDVELRGFSEGSVAYRRSEKAAPFHVYRKDFRKTGKLALVGSLFVSLLMFLPTFLRSEAKESTEAVPPKMAEPVQSHKVAPQPITRITEPPAQKPVEEILPQAVEEDTEAESEPEVAPIAPKKQKRASRRRKRSHRHGDWSMYERAARKAFQSGKISQALEYLDDIQTSNGGRLPKSLYELASEIDYAECQRAYRAKRWRTAVSSCERATSRIRHARARKMLKVLGEQSRRFFLEGYVMESTNPEASVRRYRAALAAAPSNSEYRSKAKAKLKAITGGISR